MLLEKEIIHWKTQVGITSELEDVIKLPQSDFPKLIFQDIMNQLKLPKIQIGFELNTSQLIEMEPCTLEMLDDLEFKSLKVKQTLNLSDVVAYYLLTLLLHTDFEVEYIFSNNHANATLFFQTQIPFSKSGQSDFSHSNLKQFFNRIPIKEKELIIERFFILLGDQFKDKLLLFLTYLDTKYKFKIDKPALIESVLGVKNINHVKAQLSTVLL